MYRILPSGELEYESQLDGTMFLSTDTAIQLVPQNVDTVTPVVLDRANAVDKALHFVVKAVVIALYDFL